MNQVHFMEHRCRVCDTPDSYSRGPGFKSRPEDRLSSLKFFVVSQALQANSGVVPYN
jgi:hypothetical protein